MVTSCRHWYVQNRKTSQKGGDILSEERIQALEQRVSELENLIKQISEQMLTKANKESIIQATIDEIKREERRENLRRYGHPFGGGRR